MLKLNLRQICKTVVLCLAALISAALAAQEKRSVAVLEPFTTGPITSLNKDVVMSNMNSSLVNTGIYKVVDRARSERVLKEQGITKRIHLSDPRKAKRLGNSLKAELICAADLVKEGGYLNAKLSIIDVGSGEVTNAAQKLISKDDPDSIDRAIKEVMAELLGIKIDPPKQIVADGGQKPPASPNPPQKGSQRFSGLEENISGVIWNYGRNYPENYSLGRANFKFEVDPEVTLDETAKPGTYSVSGYIKIKMTNLINRKQHATQFTISPFMGTDMDLIKAQITEQVKSRANNIFYTLYNVVR